MGFKKLPLNSEKLLHKIICTDNPVQVLCRLFEKASPKEDDELRGIIRELQQEGYIDIKWADGVHTLLLLTTRQEYTKNNSLNMVNKKHTQ